jgi:L-histidine N-alpha-methyltransferase
MRLRASRPCSVLIADLDLRVDFAAGEEMRTEISAKFTPSRVRADLEAAGLVLDTWFTDADQLFGIAVARVQSAGEPGPVPAVE